MPSWTSQQVSAQPALTNVCLQRLCSFPGWSPPVRRSGHKVQGGSSPLVRREGWLCDPRTHPWVSSASLTLVWLCPSAHALLQACSPFIIQFLIDSPDVTVLSPQVHCQYKRCRICNWSPRMTQDIVSHLITSSVLCFPSSMKAVPCQTKSKTTSALSAKPCSPVLKRN